MSKIEKYQSTEDDEGKESFKTAASENMESHADRRKKRSMRRLEHFDDK